jgi:acetyl esterase/lipase
MLFWLWQAQEIASVPRLARRAAAANRRAEPRLSVRRVAYGPHPRQYSLVFAPAEGAPRRHSTVFFVHGGGWYTGSPEEFTFVGRFLARHGYATVMAGYRLVPEFTYPVQHEDVLAAYATFQAEARGWGLPVRTVVAGQSAGAHLGAFLVGEWQKLAEHNLDRANIAGAFFVSGPLDFAVPGSSPWGRHLLKRFLGEERDWHRTDPGRLAAEWDAPLFLVHGDCDPVVTLGSSLAFARRVHQKRPGLVEVAVAAGRHHSDLTHIFLDDLRETRALLAWLEGVDAGTSSKPLFE